MRQLRAFRNRNGMRLFPNFRRFVFGFAVIAGLLALRGMIRPSWTMRGAGFDTLQRLWPVTTALRNQYASSISTKPRSANSANGPGPARSLQLVDELTELGAATIAFDVIFPGARPPVARRVLESSAAAAELAACAPSLIWRNSRTMTRSLRPPLPGRRLSRPLPPQPKQRRAEPRKAGFAQTGADATNAPPRLGKITANIPVIDAAAAGIGSINIDLAREQGVARQIPLLWTDGSRLYPSLVVEALRLPGTLLFMPRQTPKCHRKPVVGDLPLPLNRDVLIFRPDSPKHYVSAARVIGGKDREALRPLIEGHLVFVGTSAVGLLDVRTTALGESVPGVSIHAQAAEQVLSGTFLTRPEWAAGSEFLIVLLAGAAITFLGSTVRPWLTMASGGVLAGAILGVTVWPSATILRCHLSLPAGRRVAASIAFRLFTDGGRCAASRPLRVARSLRKLNRIPRPSSSAAKSATSP
jgi:adenylate cyclase